MAKAVRQFTKFLFPFHFDGNKIAPRSAQIQSKRGNTLSLFEQFSQKCESLREGLDGLLAQDGGTAKIGECYRLNINCRKEFLLPPRKTDKLGFSYRQSEGEVANVAISEIKLYFFESEVGFLEVECEYESKDIEDYIELNYFIAELKGDKNRFIFEEEIRDSETGEKSKVKHEFTLKDLLGKVIDAASKEEGGIRLLNEYGKAIVYSYLLVDEKPQDINNLLQHFAKNYKQSYKFDDSCTKTRLFHPFENTYWTSSLNGVINLSYMTGDENTDSFFKESFYTKAKNTYYFLFLNVLHQRYAIARMMGEMGHLDRLSNDYYVMEQQLKAARRCEAKAINLKFRAFFKCPSLIDHANEYYNVLYQTFEVDLLYSSFTADITNLQGICNTYIERIKEREAKFKQRKDAKVEIFVSIFGAIVAEVSLFNNSWALVEKVLGRSVSFWSPGIFILLGTLLSPLFTIVINVNKKRVEIKKLTAEIDAERDEKLVEDDKERKKKGKVLAQRKKINKKKLETDGADKA